MAWCFLLVVLKWLQSSQAEEVVLPSVVASPSSGNLGGLVSLVRTARNERDGRFVRGQPSLTDHPPKQGPIRRSSFPSENLELQNQENDWVTHPSSNPFLSARSTKPTSSVGRCWWSLRTRLHVETLVIQPRESNEYWPCEHV